MAYAEIIYMAQGSATPRICASTDRLTKMQSGKERVQANVGEKDRRKCVKSTGTYIHFCELML